MPVRVQVPHNLVIMMMPCKLERVLVLQMLVSFDILVALLELRRILLGLVIYMEEPVLELQMMKLMLVPDSQKILLEPCLYYLLEEQF